MISTIIDTIPVRVFWKDRNLVYTGCNTEFAMDAGFSSPVGRGRADDYRWRGGSRRNCAVATTAR
jgi:hypothetical protein